MCELSCRSANYIQFIALCGERDQHSPVRRISAAKLDMLSSEFCMFCCLVQMLEVQRILERDKVEIMEFMQVNADAAVPLACKKSASSALKGCVLRYRCSLSNNYT